jgi:RHS repeat-associated protein
MYDCSHKLTGKERDSESGLDMYGARYYGSSLGRFMTPDWAAKPVTVPYAEFGDPQSLNLYGYVRNNPVTRADADGHACADPATCSMEIGAGIGTVVEPGGGTVVGGTIGLVVGITIDAGLAGYALYQHFHPDNGGQNVPPPPSVPTNVSQGTPGTTATNLATGTPASTSQQGAVNTGPIESRSFSSGSKDRSRCKCRWEM